MVSSLLMMALVLAVLAALPWLINKWRAQTGRASALGEGARLVSVLAVGPHQRVITVEAGPEGQRCWLTLGVTQQNITLLHSAPVSAPGSAAASTFGVPTVNAAIAGEDH